MAWRARETFDRAPSYLHGGIRVQERHLPESLTFPKSSSADALAS